MWKVYAAHPSEGDERLGDTTIEHGMDMARDERSMGRPQQLLVELATRFQHLILSSHGFRMIMPLCKRRCYERS